MNLERHKQIRHCDVTEAMTDLKSVALMSVWVQIPSVAPLGNLLSKLWKSGVSTSGHTVTAGLQWGFV